MSTTSSDLSELLRVVYAASGVRKGAPDTFIICDKPSSPFRVGDIIEIDILDGYRYRTWDVRIICLRVVEEEMVEFAGYLHGPLDGALPTYMLFQCPRSWVQVDWLTALLFRLCRIPGTPDTIPHSHPLPGALCSIKAFRNRYRGSVDAGNPERRELVGGVFFTITNKSIPRATTRSFRGKLCGL